MSVTRVVLALALVGALAACASDPDDSASTTSSTPTSTPTSTSTSTGSSVGDVPDGELVVPPGVLAAVPFQYRIDVTAGIFQLRLYNGTEEDIDIVGGRLVWDGLTTERSERATYLVAGGRLDYPVAVAPARCVGDGTAATMPDPSAAIVEVTLRDGTVVKAPLVDLHGTAERLYVDDCERQHIEASARFEWVDLHEVDLDGRPVTDATLRITRLESTSAITVRGIKSTVTFTASPLDADGVALSAADVAAVGSLAVLRKGDAVVDLPVRFLEGRCDAHARSESSQPFAFVVLVDLGDGVERGLTLLPDQAEQRPMRARVDHACDVLGASGFAGQGETDTGATGTDTTGTDTTGTDTTDGSTDD